MNRYRGGEGEEHGEPGAGDGPAQLGQVPRVPVVVLCGIILCYIILYCIILYYIVLYYIILYYII